MTGKITKLCAAEGVVCAAAFYPFDFFSGKRYNKRMIRPTKRNYLNVLKNAALTVLDFALCTALCFLLDFLRLNDLNFLIIYILGILLLAVFTKGYTYSWVLSLICVLGYNFFFTEPRFSLKINDSNYLATFILMFAVGVAISLITFQLKKKMSQINALNLEKMKLKTESEKEQLKATLLRSISHDLRTPLTTIKNGAELLLEKPEIGEEDKREILGDIYGKSDWTIRLVENLLSLSRIDNEKLTVKKKPEALEEIVPQAVRTVSGKLGGRTVHYDMPEELLLVPMDATLIIQVLCNILDNAAKHTAEDGNIWIKVWNTGKNAVFRISNDGSPMRKEDLPHIFEMYYTAGEEDSNGVGLGLAICQLIIKAHGGGISARNADGLVVFEFNLPMEDQNG